jgi:hypothetical protein
MNYYNYHSMKYLKKLPWFTLVLLIFVSCINEPKLSDKQPGNTNQPAPAEKSLAKPTEEQSQVAASPVAQEPGKNQAETSSPKDVKLAKPLLPISVFEPAYSPEPSGWPVIIFLDPHANGHFPVSMYQNLATKYGFLLLGSNEIKNGMPGTEIVASFDKLFNTMKKDYHIDNNRIYLMGFSGGARLSLAFAEAYPEISAVVACGAGIQAGVKAPEPTFSYLGMAGNQDFNMIEVINTDRSLKRQGYERAMILFEGDHNWPPAEVAEEAFQWLDLVAMKNKSKPFDQAEINSIKTVYLTKINKLKDAGRIFESYELAERAMTVFSGLSDVNDLKTLGGELNKNPLYKEQLSEMVKTMQTEMGLQNTYAQAFVQKDTAWWSNEIKKLQDDAVPVNEQLMQKRLLAYLGIMAYMISDRAVNEKDIKGAEKYLEIYRTLEPENPEHVYLEAKRRMAMNENSKALSYLQLAVILGFNDEYRLYNDPVFAPLKDNPDFKALLD